MTFHSNARASHMKTSPPNRTGARILVDALRTHGVGTIFCVPGESYLETLDALYDVSNEIKLIVCRHEAGAVHMAEAYGKLTGRPGICIVTRGPGATHGSIGVHAAHQASTPLIMMVGQVDRDHMDREALQEIDYRRMFGDMTKWVTQIEIPARIPEQIARAFQTATSGRPGPVVLSLPEDMQREEAAVADTAPYRPVSASPGAGDMAELAALLGAAERPVAIVGGGGWTPAACADITRFMAAHDLPAACTFRRQDIIDNTHPNYVGDLSPGSNPALVERIKEADLLLVVGSRLDEVSTQRYTMIEAPVPRQVLIHIHPDSNVLGSVYQPRLPIQSGMPGFAAAAAGLAGPGDAPAWAAWRADARADYEEALIPNPYDGDLDLGQCMVWLRENLPADAIIAIDGGNFSAWPMRFLTWRRPRTQLAPQAGAMGAGAPAAVAASLVHPDRVVVGFAGDGGFMMTGQEMATAVQYGATPIYMVFDNGMYGTIRMHQERDHPARTIGTTLINPDFAAFARAYGAHGETVTRTEEFAPAFERARDADKCALIHLKMDPEVITTRASLSEIRDAALAKA
jgi:acetolactate synthase-1/2/3 large subunit